MDFYADPVAIRVAKPTLLVPGGNPSEMGGEVLVFEDQVKFVQILGS